MSESLSGNQIRLLRKKSLAVRHSKPVQPKQQYPPIADRPVSQMDFPMSDKSTQQRAETPSKRAPPRPIYAKAVLVWLICTALFPSWSGVSGNRFSEGVWFRAGGFGLVGLFDGMAETSVSPVFWPPHPGGSFQATVRWPWQTTFIPNDTERNVQLAIVIDIPFTCISFFLGAAFLSFIVWLCTLRQSAAELTIQTQWFRLSWSLLLFLVLINWLLLTLSGFDELAIRFLSWLDLFAIALLIVLLLIKPGRPVCVHPNI